VAGDARAFLAERLLGNLNDDFLALLKHVRDELSAARLLRAMVAMSAAVPLLRTATAIFATSPIPATTARWVLHTRPEIVAHTRLEGLLRLAAGIFTRQDSAIFLGCCGCCDFLLVCASWLFLRMRDHAFFFGCGLLLFEFGIFGLFFGGVFRCVCFLVRGQSSGFGDRVCFRKATFLRVSCCELVLRVGDVFGYRGGFVFSEFRVRVVFVVC
jgi:hypothetical protein